MKIGGIQSEEERRIRAGWLIDGCTDRVQQDVVLTVRDGTVVAIQPPCSSRPATHDYCHSTVLPPLMDAHVHLAFSGALDMKRRKDQLSQTMAQALAIIREHVAAHRRCGVMAVRDGGDPLGAVPAFKHQLGPALKSFHLAATQWAWHAKGRYGRMLGQALPDDIPPGQAVSAYLEQSDHLKLILSGLNSLDRFGDSGVPQFSETALRDMVQAAQNANRPVMAHANGETAVAMALDAGCHSIEHGYFMGDENLQRMADEGTCWVPTMVPMAALVGAAGLTSHQREVALKTRDHQLEQVRKAWEMGVEIVLGTDAGSHGVDHGIAVRQELRLLMTAGLGPAAAVACATGRAARLLGLKARGQLAPGRPADLLIVPGPPERLPESLGAIDTSWMAGA